MYDQYQREIDYLRISITDRCNLRCIYCMPAEGVEMASHSDILSYDEILRICRNAAHMGIKKIKITGGEPLVRKDAPLLVKAIKEIPGIEKVTLTTNGLLLGEVIDELVQYGIDSINISLDTLDSSKYEEITRFSLLPKVLENIEKVLAYPQIALKINCVPMNLSDQNLASLATLAKDHLIHVRFIEMMPIGYGKDFEFVSEQEIVNVLEQKFGPLTPFAGRLGNGPCHYYEIDGFQGKIGFISALSHKFCDQCNRVRLTSQGYLKACLQYEIGTDLKPLLRSGASDEELIAAMKTCIGKKPKGHEFLTREFADKPENSLSMSKIGG